MLATSYLKKMLICLFAGLLLLPVAPAIADDWEVAKLRGGVFAFDGDSWIKLERGSIVSDERVIRTSRNGRAQFVRDGETVDIGRDTQIRIYDKYRDGFTIVQQHFGVVEVEAEVQNVKHFAVQTPHLAAVVKGTRFKVTSDSDRAEVSVERGKVEVRDEAREQSVMINQGQSAIVSETQAVAVSGPGQVEAVLSFSGQVIVPAQVSAFSNRHARDGDDDFDDDDDESRDTGHSVDTDSDNDNDDDNDSDGDDDDDDDDRDDD